MSDTALSVETLGKRYRLRPLKAAYQTLRDSLAEALRFGGEAPQEGSEFWALKEVSFELRRGQVLGLIGRNGAGKSTLLKILSRITHPTEGAVEIAGQVGSLLEVGTGFHPELTGRENIYLNGAILGMKRREIERKFEEIAAFAEVERFLETPVKHYSSGMYLRLAFAVAAHLEPEVLLVDEVLAVGDVPFQKKCLGKMGQIAGEGRTVIFVSHNLNAIQRLCGHGLLLDGGRVDSFGPVDEVVSRYLAMQSSECGEIRADRWIELGASSRRRGGGQVRFASVKFAGPEDCAGRRPSAGEALEFWLALESDQPRELKSLSVIFYDRYGTKLLNMDTLSLGQLLALKQGRNEVHLRVESLPLNAGVYAVGFWAAEPGKEVFDFFEPAFELEIFDRTARGLGIRPACDGMVRAQFAYGLR